MNRIMTVGRDKYWRKEVIHRAAIPDGGLLLDLGAGTGELAQEALHQYPSCRVIAADFSPDMMNVGKEHLKGKFLPHHRLDWCAADALHLPFPDRTIDTVVSGFLLRNVNDIQQSIAEQFRVLKRGGGVVVLDTSPPPRSLITPLIRFYLHKVIPTLGRIITGHPEAYQYLSVSTENFLVPEKLAACLSEAGFQEVGFRRSMFSMIGIRWGCKPPGEGMMQTE